MLPPPAERTAEPYLLPCGTRPRRGSGLVEHLVLGLVMDPEALRSSTPDSGSWVGRIDPGYSRTCGEFDLRWSPSRDGQVS